MIRFPVPTEELDRLKALLGTTKPSKPYAFIFGHGLWNDLDLQATLDWLDTILESTTSQLPYLAKPGAFWPRLFLTPNAAGREKPDEWLVSQGNKALMLFEEAVGVEAGRRGVEHLGTWNMSIQSNKFDGVYAVAPLIPEPGEGHGLTLMTQACGLEREFDQSDDGHELVEYVGDRETLRRDDEIAACSTRRDFHAWHGSWSKTIARA